MKTLYMNYKNREGVCSVIQRHDPSKLWRIRVDEYDQRTLDQNSKAHAMLADIARQAKHLNQHLSADDWKRLAVAQFRADCLESDGDRLADYWRRNDFKIIPSLDGKSLVTLGTQTRDFPKYVMAGLIDWLYRYGAENNIVWSEPEQEWDDGRAAA